MLHLVFLFILMISSGATAASSKSISYGNPSQVFLKIDEVAFARCLAGATFKAFPNYYLNKYSTPIPFNLYDFMEYLEASPYRTFDYESGHEASLKEWILKQENYSIDPVLIYVESLRENGGEIWGSLLTIHQLLRNMARYKEKKRYKYDKTNDLEASIFFDKFIDIRGDLAERGPEFLGDHRGTWYRICGMMLYRLMGEDDRLPRISLTPELEIPKTERKELNLTKQFKYAVRDFLPKIIGEVAEASKINKTYALDKRKSEYNVMAGDTMSLLIRRLWLSKRTLDEQISAVKYYQPSCDARDYLVSAGR